jgi:hypothetical protein
VIDLLKYRIFRLREGIRTSSVVSKFLYMLQNIQATFTGRLLAASAPANAQPRGVAVCLRFRDEARYLNEWITYHLAAGVRHIYLYNNFSEDDYGTALAPHIEAGRVTLIDWPFTPASPSAEEDCIVRAIGRYEWVGFLDADEFVVIGDGRSIPDYLNDFADMPGVALHWHYFGSNGHRTRPPNGVIQAYIRRQSAPNRHVKCFVRPERVTQNRNSHSWFFRNARWAVDENRNPVLGSISAPTATYAWINHYYCKSLEDFLEKAQRTSTLDVSGMKHPTRKLQNAEAAIQASNDVEDRSAIEYYRIRQKTMERDPPDEGP